MANKLCELIMPGLRASRTLLLNSLLLLGVPAPLRAAFEAPDPNPLSFALANQISFPNHLFLDGASGATWGLSVGGARLFGMPEIQPFGFRAAGIVPGGRMNIRAAGLKSGPYSEAGIALGYEKTLPQSLKVGLEAQLFQVAIEDYGTARSPQLNAHVEWNYWPRLNLAFTWINLTAARFGEGHYPLPRRLALGAMLQAAQNLHVLLELEKDLRYSLSPRFGLGYSPYERITLLAAFQSDPNIVSAGASVLIGPHHDVRATAAYQYHPDLGFSQCYGIAVFI